MDEVEQVVPRRTIPVNRIWMARAVAAAADLIQIGAFPVTVGGAAFGVDAVIDVVAAVVLTGLVGWHIAFVPAFVVEALPVADLAPTWTLAVLIATAGRGGGAATPLAPVPTLPAADPGGRRSTRSARVRAIAWFAVLFAIGFAVGKVYLMPHLPPVAGHVPAGTSGPWSQNWAGALLGGGLGLLAARTVLRRAGRWRS